MFFLVPPHARQAEIITKCRDARFSHTGDNLFEPFYLLLPLRAIQQDVIPIRRIEIFDPVEFQTIFPGLLFDPEQAVQLPYGIPCLGISIIDLVIRSMETLKTTNEESQL